MADANLHSSFPTLLQHFFVDHLHQQRAVSPNTIAAYRDTFKLLLLYAEKGIGKSPTGLSLRDLDATLILGFLDHLERNRGNSVRSRNARLSAIRSFLKYAAHHDLSTLATIEHGLAVPSKRQRQTGARLSDQARDGGNHRGARSAGMGGAAGSCAVHIAVQHGRRSIGGHQSTGLRRHLGHIACGTSPWERTEAAERAALESNSKHSSTMEAPSRQGRRFRLPVSKWRER